MLSLYEEFPDDPVTQRSAKEEEVEFHFIVSSVPEKRVVSDDYAKDNLKLQLMLMPGVALRLLPDGEVTTGSIHVRYPHLFHTRQGKTLWDPREIADLEPFKVYRARGSYFFSDIRKEPYVTIWEILDPLPDPEMEELSAKTAEPVILEANIGQLVLDRTFSTFEGKADDLGVKVSMWYEGPELLLAGQGNMAKKFKSALNFINNVLSQEYLDKARMLGAEKALPAANRWRHDVAEAEGRSTPAPKLGVEDVYAKLTPTVVSIPHRGKRWCRVRRRVHVRWAPRDGEDEEGRNSHLDRDGRLTRQSFSHLALPGRMRGACRVVAYSAGKPDYKFDKRSNLPHKYSTRKVEQDCIGDVETSFIGVTEGTIVTSTGTYYARTYSNPARVECAEFSSMYPSRRSP